MDSLEEPPAKRRKPSPREIGVMRKSSVDNSATFLGSSSGVHFIRIVYDAFARRSAHLNQNQSQSQTTLVYSSIYARFAHSFSLWLGRRCGLFAALA